MRKDDQIFYVGLKAFVEKDGKLLILQDQDGLWELPGGKIEVGENIPTTLNREIREELGGNVEIEMGPTTFYAWIRKPDPNRDFLLFLVGFPCVWKGGEIILSPEHKNFHWITKEEIENTNFENTYKQAIQRYFESYSR
jgi:8-oxo-dGTP pyrophosphatase MutT (NUDIX family)